MRWDRNMDAAENKPARRARAGWIVVTSQELSALWKGGRIPALFVPYSIVLSFMSYLLATNKELSLTPPKEMVFFILQITLAVSLLISLIIGANAISGERENGTFESLLVTPVSRRQIILGKFLAALSPWPFLLAISTVYIALLAPTAQIFWLALLLASVLGTLLVIISAGFGLLISIYSNSNRTSLSVSLVVLLLSLVETQLPSGGQTGNVGRLFKRINPIESTLQVTEKVLVNNRTITEMNNPAGSEGFWLLSPLLGALLVLVLLFVFGHAHLSLHARLGLEDKLKRLRSLRRGRSSALMIVFVLAGTFMFILASYSFAARALALDSATKQTNQAEPLQISIDRRYEVTKTGDEFDFITQVKNIDPHKQSGPLVVAMNIINLGSGQPVDPEDWSPERTQAIGSLEPGQASELTWTIESILKGDYLIYMVVTPKPVGSTSTSQPVASSAIHLTVKPHTRLNPGGILPLAIGTPTALTVVWLGLRAVRRREVEWTPAASE
jgi:ABC-type transport system involved in multi-copper enzyme maturation permease subunit